MQIVTGIFLTMHYKPDAAQAFESVEYIMRDVSWGWLIRYMHSTGASMFFVVVYLHMFRALLYGSLPQAARAPLDLRHAHLPCADGRGVLRLPAAVGPDVVLGRAGDRQPVRRPFRSSAPDLAVWIRGDYVVSDITLNRFFAFHVIALPLVLLGLVAAHLMALHEVGSNNPDGVEIKKQPKDPRTGLPLDGISVHPYYTVKDIMGVVVFLIVFSIVVFFLPEMGGYFLEHNNFIPADPLKTPEHIAPVWYFTPYYSILRAVPSFARHPGVGRAGDGDRGADPLRDALARPLPGPVDPLPRPALQDLAGRCSSSSFLVLGYLGIEPVTVWGQFSEGLPLVGGADKATVLARVFTIVYFLFFLLMPWYTARDRVKPDPERVR